MPMTKEDAEQYVNRYREIGAVEDSELLALTPEASYFQIAILMQAASDFEWAQQPRDEESVRATWLKLKRNGRLP